MEIGIITGNIVNQANQNEIYINNGNGIFTLWQAFGTYCGYPVVLGDIDNDNDIDMITGGYRTIVYLNDGTGHFEESEHNLEGTGSDIVLADIHNDEDLDLITTGLTNILYINTLITVADSDGDSYSDGEEVDAGFDPNDPAEYPILPQSTPSPLPPTTITIESESPAFFIPGFTLVELGLALACLVGITRRITKW